MRQNQPCLESGPLRGNSKCKGPEAGLGQDMTQGGVSTLWEEPATDLSRAEVPPASWTQSLELGLHPAQVFWEKDLPVAGSNCWFSGVFLDFLYLEVVPCGYLYGRL